MANLRLNEIRVLLALSKPRGPLTIEEIAEATAEDTPSKKPITTATVRKALEGVPKNETAHEHQGYPGLLASGFVTRRGDHCDITPPGRDALDDEMKDDPDGGLPDPRPGPGSRKT